MPNLYARATALPNVVGRIDYISSPNRQENLLAVFDNAKKLADGQFWDRLGHEAQAAYEQHNERFRMVKDKETGEMKKVPLKCCQARETVIQLSNELLMKMSPEKIAKVIAWEYKKKLGLDVVVAIHFNKAKNNLHAHVIFPERQLLQTPDIRIAERNLFFNEEGKRVYKKNEILDENRQLRPGCHIVKKGEVYHEKHFSAANPKYQSKEWLRHAKTDVILPMLNGKLRGDVEIGQYDPATGELPFQHVGNKLKGEKKADVEAYNDLVRIYNRKVRSGEIPHAQAMKIQAAVFASKTKTATLQQEMDKLEQYRAQAMEDLQKQEMALQLTTTLAIAAEKKLLEERKREEERRLREAEARAQERREWEWKQENRHDTIIICAAIYWEKYVVPAEAMSFEESLEYWRIHDPYMYEDQLVAQYEIETWAAALGGHDRLLVECMTMEYANHPPATDEEVLEELERQYPDSDLIPVYREKVQKATAYQVGELTGYSNDEIDAMYEVAKRATNEERQDAWASTKDIKAGYWDDYKEQMADIKKAKDALYRRRKFEKHIEWVMDPRNKRTSLVQLLVVLVYVTVRKEDLSSIDMQLHELKEREANLRRNADLFRSTTNDTNEILRQTGRSVADYTKAIQKMQDVAEQLHNGNAQHFTYTPQKPRKPIPPPWLKEYNTRPFIEAQRKLLLQVAAKNDYRRVVRPEILAAPKELEKAISVFKVAHLTEMAAEKDYRKSIIGRAEKKKAWEEAQANSRAAFDKMVEWSEVFPAPGSSPGISRMYDNSELTGAGMSKDAYAATMHTADVLLKDLRERVAKAKKFGRPADMPERDDRARVKAQRELEELCRTIPEQHRDFVWKKMTEDLLEETVKLTAQAQAPTRDDMKQILEGIFSKKKPEHRNQERDEPEHTRQPEPWKPKPGRKKDLDIDLDR